MEINLKAGITLYKQGKTLEARQVFLACIRADQSNMSAWFWLVETISEVNEQIAALIMCQKANPGNLEVARLISMLSAQQSPKFLPKISEQSDEGIPADAETLYQHPETPYDEAMEIDFSPLSPGEVQFDWQKQPVTAEYSVEPIEGESVHLRKGIPEEREQQGTTAPSVPPVRVPEVGEENSQAKPSALPSLKKNKRQSFFVFLAKVISILFLLGILFAIAFLVWWVSSGRTTRDLVAAVLPGTVVIATPESQETATSVPSQLPTIVQTETPVPTQTPTITPSPTLDPAFVMLLQDSIEPDESIAFPVIAAQSEALGWFAFLNSSGMLEVVNLTTQQSGIEISLSSPIQALAFSPEGAFLAGVQDDGKVTVWNTVSWEEVVTSQLEVNDQELTVFQLDFVPGEDGYLMGYCVQSMGECVGAPRVAFFETTTGRLKYELSGVNRFSVSQGNELLVWLQDKTPAQVRLVSIKTGSTMLVLPLPDGTDPDGWNAAAFSEDYSLVAAATLSGRVVVWELTSGRIISDWASEIPDIQQIVFIPGLSQILVDDAKSLAKVWDYGRNTVITDFNFYSDYARVFTTSSGRLIGIRSVASSIEILDVNGLVSLQSFQVERSPVTRVFLYSQSEMLVVINENGAITVWQSNLLR